MMELALIALLLLAFFALYPSYGLATCYGQGQGRCQNASISVSATRDYDILMTVGGSYNRMVEFTDLSGQRRPCPAVPEIPESESMAVGAFIDGRAIVCGGFGDYGAPISECWTYHSDVTEKKTNFFFRN